MLEPLYCLATGWNRNLRDYAASEWEGATPQQLFIAISYEGFWQLCVLSYGVHALSYLVLFSSSKERSALAKLATLFGATQCCCFMSGVFFASSRYNNSCPEAATFVFGLCNIFGIDGVFLAFFICIFISGVVHMRGESAQAESSDNSSARAPGNDLRRVLLQG